MRTCGWFLAAVLVLAAGVRAQGPNPVYADFSPIAADTLAHIEEFVAAGNLGEAARECQRLLDEHAQRVTPAGTDPDLFASVRSRVHAALLASPPLLARYRDNEGPVARSLLDRGTLAAAGSVEETRLLTPAGYDAALRVAQDHLESARFDAARITLEQLENHPERRGDASARAARLLAEVAGYLDEPGRTAAVVRAQRWAGATGPVVPPATERPPGVGAAAYILGAAASRVEPSASAAPLWSTFIDPTWEPPPASPQFAGAGALAMDESRLWVVPVVVGDTLYTNDGTTITARDRFTLQPRWSSRPEADRTVEDPEGVHSSAGIRGAGRAVEDPCFVTVSGRVVLATTGLARDGGRDGDPRTHALDAATGRVLWSRFVPDLDTQLESGSVRGPVLVEGDIAVVVVRKAALARRVVSVYLAGLSLRTGDLLWVRLVGSAGALPYVQQRRIGDAAVLDRGVVYLQDQLGVIAAVEAATGRPVWVRRTPVPHGGDQGTMPWRWGQPVVDPEGMVVLTPDQDRVMRLDRETGEVTGSRSAAQLGDPAYITRAGDDIACVGKSRVSLLPATDIAAGPIRATKALPSDIRGRVIQAGNQLLLPRAEGFTLVDLAHPEADGQLRPLDAPGNVLPVPGQLIVLDGLSAHSYLDWPLADQLLSQRMARDPADPAPAITYAELAFRAGQPDRIVAAADKALAALDQGADPAMRSRLFASLREMVAATLAPEAPARALPSGVLANVIERLGRAAQTPGERVTHLMALGKLEETRDRAAPAIQAYQRVLEDPALAATLWDGAGRRVRAELEATRRVRMIVASHGPGVYAPFDAEAEFAARALGPSPTPGALERLAAQYPATVHAASVWARAAALHARAGRTHAATADLREALAACELALAVGQRLEPTLPGEVAGQLISILRDSGENYAALRLLRRLGGQTPAITPSVGGRPMDLPTVEARLVQALAGEDRLPRIGSALGSDPQALIGWSIMTPASRARVSPEHVMMLNRAGWMVALWGVPPSRAGAANAAGPEQLSMLWSRQFEQAEPQVVRLEPAAVYLLWDMADLGSSIEKIDAVTGQTLWKSDAHTRYFTNEPAWPQRASLTPDVIETPIDGQVRPLYVLVAVSDQAVVLSDRAGRVVAFDPASGVPLWHALSPAWHVHDLAAAGGVVAVCGIAPPPENPGAMAGWRSVIEVLDARTGAPTFKAPPTDGVVRWVRLAGDAGDESVLVALDASIVSIDAATGERNWEWAGSGGFQSIAAWVVAEHLFVLAEDRSLWMVPVRAGGDAQTRPLDTFDRLIGNWPVVATTLPAPTGPLATFASGRGVLIYDPGTPEKPGRGGSPAALVGIDSLVPQQNVLDPTGMGLQLITPVVTERSVVALEQWPSPLPDQRPAYALHLLDTRSGRLQGPTRSLVLWAAPQAVAVIDGRILVTTIGGSAVTLVYAAPPADK